MKNSPDSNILSESSQKNILNYLGNVREFLLPLNFDIKSEDKQKIVKDINNKISSSNIKTQDLDCLMNEEILEIFRSVILKKNLTSSVLEFYDIVLILKPEITKKYRKIYLHFLLSKLIENNTDSKTILDTLRLLKSWIQKSYQNFPSLCGFSLIYLANQKTMSTTKKMAIELLRILAINNIDIFSWIGGFEVLINAILSNDINDLEDKISNTIIYLLDEEKSRNIIIKNFHFGKIFAVFTDIKGNSNIKDESAIELGRMASGFLLKLLSSDSGLFFLIDNRRYMKSLVDSLRQPHQAKNSLFELFEDLLDINKQQPIHTLVLQLELLIKCDFYQILIEMAMIDKHEEKAKDLLKKFLKLCYQIYPLSEIPQNDFLIYSMKTEMDYNIEYENKTLISKIKSILDNNSQILLHKQLLNYFEMNPNRQMTRKNDFLYRCEKLYLKFPVSFKDTRVSNEEPWNFLNIEEQLKLEECSSLFFSFQENHTKWDFRILSSLLDFLYNNDELLKENINKPLFRNLLHFFKPRENSFYTVEWNMNNFRYIELAYKFFKILLNSKSGCHLLESNDNESAFVVSESFMICMKKILTQHEHLRGSLAITYYDTNFTKKRSSNFFKSFNGNNYKEKTIKQKQPSLEIFNQTITLKKDYFSLIGFFTNFKYGRNLLKSNNIFKDLLSLSSLPQYDDLLSIILLSCNYIECSNSINLLINVLKFGSDYLRKICLNIISFLLNSENYSFIYKYFIDDIIDILINKKQKKTKKLKKLIVHILEEMILNSKFDKNILEILPIETTKNSKKLFYAFMRKENCIELIIENGLINSEYERFMNENDPNKYYDEKDEKIESKNERYMEEQYYFTYKHSSQNIDSCFSDSGYYLSSLLRYPWNLKIRIQKDNDHNDFLLRTFAYYNKEKHAIEISGIPINKNFDSVFQNKFDFDDKTWSFGVSLFIGPYSLDTQLKIVKEYFDMINAYSIKRLLDLDNGIIQLKKNGIECFFEEENKREKLIGLKTGKCTYRLRKIILFVFLDKNNDNKKESGNNFFETICQTKKGSEYLKTSKILDKTISNIMKIKSIGSGSLDSAKNSLLSIGNIGKNENGIKIIQNNKILLDLILREFSQQTKFLTLKATCYCVAQMFSSCKTGREILKKYNWNVFFISKKKINENNDHYIVLSSKVVSNKNLQKSDLFNIYLKNTSKRWFLFNLITMRIQDKYKNDNIVLKVINVILEPKLKERLKHRESLNDIKHYIVENKLLEKKDLFFFIIIQLSFFKFSRYRKFFWKILELYFRYDQFFYILENNEEGDKNYQEFILNV